MYQEVLTQVQLDEEKLLLDAGCGSGLFLSMASATGALLHGIDAASGLLDISKKRLPGAILMSEDLEKLPYIDGTFDIVTGFNSFQYAGNIEAALAESCRVVKRRGQVAIGVWDKEEACDAAMIFGAVSSLMPSSTAATSGTFALSKEGRLEAMCRAFKLKTVSKSSIFCPWQFNSDEELIRGFLSTATCAIAVQTAGESAVKDAILSSSQPFSMADDVYFLRNFFTLLIAEKM
jgi:2-polyprenyl-3-methyl-5-hydroxy-6-metoxy-1,4-benzoquinol methylase